ncbi:MAG: VCBS repeat-containing protein, partial [Bacteroidota bacterium]
GGRVRPGEYPLPPSSYLFRNESEQGNIRFEEDPNKPAEFEALGMVTAALWTDFNNDGWPDLMVVGEFMSLHIYQNDKGTLRNMSDATGLQNTSGWWHSIVAGDFDNDGDSDYILGNLGLNSRYKASVEEPLCIYAKDYDKNGQIDPVMCHYIDGENYIAHSRNDLIEQINVMRVRFRSYSDYARATFEESFLKEELEDALVVKSETFASSYLENLGNGRFRLSQLPRQAQIAPIYGIVPGDFNGDTYLDFLAVGNFYSGEVFSGRYDASIGWLMLGDGKGNFNSLPQSESGFLVDGDAKALARLRLGEDEAILATLNNGPLKAHKYNVASGATYKAGPQDVAALITFADGSQRKVEFYYGEGYLSQSDRLLRIPPGASKVVVMNSKGDQTEIALEK